MAQTAHFDDRSRRMSVVPMDYVPEGRVAQREGVRYENLLRTDLLRELAERRVGCFRLQGLRVGGSKHGHNGTISVPAL